MAMRQTVKRRLERLDERINPPHEGPNIEVVLLPDVLVVDAPVAPKSPSEEPLGPTTKIEVQFVQLRWPEDRLLSPPKPG